MKLGLVLTAGVLGVVGASTAAACGGASDGASDGASAAFCNGAPEIKGTCAEPVLQQLAACFSATGTCQVANVPATGTEAINITYCWASGERIEETTAPSGGLNAGTWTAKGTKCMTAAGAAVYTIGDKTTYDTTTGALTCPNGSSVQVGNLARCAELAPAFVPSCDAGTCP